MKEMHRSQYRMPFDLAEWLKETAENNYRSMNGQLVVILQDRKAQHENVVRDNAGKAV